jgi:RNA polymerase sigma-70 factor (ECF subfamily)
VATDRIQGTAERAAADERAADLRAVERTVAGDRAAFGELVSRWQDRIYAVVVRMIGDPEDARDLAQETFLRAWTNLRSFEGTSSFGTWLHAIAINQVRSEMRKRSAAKRGAPLSLDALGAGPGDETSFDPADPAPTPAGTATAREDVVRLRRAIAELDPEQREALVLREFQGLSYEEIATALGIPVGTVRSRLFRARDALRARLEETP